MFCFYSSSRTYEVQNPIMQDEALHLQPPLLETVRRMDDAKTVDDYILIASTLLSRNEEGETITTAEVAKTLDYDQLRRFIGAYREWLTRTKANDPN